MGDADASLYQAAANGHPAVVRALIAAGADVNSLNAQGRTPLWINAARSPRDDTQIAHSLVNAGAAIERADASGDTPLIAAARADHADLVGFRITGGADAGHRNQGGETALLLAVINNHADSVRQLLVRGADPQTQVNGITPLSAARKRNENENDIARLLRAYGAGG